MNVKKALETYREILNRHAIDKNKEGKSLHVIKCLNKEKDSLINYLKLFSSLSGYKINCKYNNDYLYVIVRGENTKRLTKKNS